MSGKHTPGPWACRESQRGGWSVHAPETPGASIAECWSHANQYTGLQYHAEANARLIASAPDLLEALKAALPYIERMYDESAPVLPMVRGAIQKAEGGQA